MLRVKELITLFIASLRHETQALRTYLSLIFMEVLFVSLVLLLNYWLVVHIFKNLLRKQITKTLVM